jgi:hypothetical protein
MIGGLVSRTFGRWHALGPYIYAERGGFMLHAGVRWFRLDYQHGLRWWWTLRLRGRFVAFGGRR